MIQMPVDRFFNAVKMARQSKSEAFNAVKDLCNWWNHESGCPEDLRCADAVLIWASKGDGQAYTLSYPDIPAAQLELFTQPSWRSSVAACGESVVAIFLKSATHYTLDKHGFLHTFLVNGTEYESLGVDDFDYRDDAAWGLHLFHSRFPSIYGAIGDTVACQSPGG